MTVGRRVPPLLLALALAPGLSSAQGLSTYRAQMWDEEQIGLPDAAESVDELGSAVASGDFNGDGYSDLAMGAPYEALPIAGDTASDAGVVLVLYGGVHGLALAGAEAWTQDSPGIAEQVEEGDLLGWLTSAAGEGFGAVVLNAGALTHYSYALRDAIEACDAAWGFYRGIFRVVIPDNTKTIVQHADPLEPRLTPTFLEYAQARGFVSDPTRVRQPRDKAQASYCTPFRVWDAHCG